MSLHQRWLCADCGREWLHAQILIPPQLQDYRPWEQGDPCLCGSTNVALEKYTPAFYGGDIPRPDTPDIGIPAMIAAAAAEVIAANATRFATMRQGDWDRLAADAKDARRNHTLEMASSSPEFD